MNTVIFLVILLALISIHLKGYYAYKFFVLEKFGTHSDGLIKFSFKATHVKHKMHSFGFFPILSNPSSDESEKARRMSNLFLAVFYASILFVIGYSFLVGKYVEPK